MIENEIALSDREFARIQERVYAEAGISLSEAKRTLVVSRLSKILRGMGIASFDAYVDHLERTADPKAAQDFVNALTTNLTRFYREDHHFEHLVEYVTTLVKSRSSSGAGKQRLRIWSAGCSTGQEPYTIALCLYAAIPELKRWDFKILATDIDTNVIAKAATGMYAEGDLTGLSPERTKLFEKSGAGMVRIPALAREVVSFKPLNLMNATWPMKGPFDAVFCRNVAIYFDKQTQGAVFSRLGKLIAPGGYLYIGHSENLGSGSDGFRLIGKTIYQTRAAQARDAA